MLSCEVGSTYKLNIEVIDASSVGIVPVRALSLRNLRSPPNNDTTKQYHVPGRSSYRRSSVGHMSGQYCFQNIVCNTSYHHTTSTTAHLKQHWQVTRVMSMGGAPPPLGGGTPPPLPDLVLPYTIYTSYKNDGALIGTH